MRSASALRPLVSVIVPAWNAEATLDETLRSVARQTYAELEIIIVDDGSTDATGAIAADFCAREPRARLIAQDNAGVAAARNRAIAEAGGQWIAPIDADDLWHPTKIEKQVAEALSSKEEPGFVYCWHRLIDESGKVIGTGPEWTIRGRAFHRLSYVNFVQNGSALLLSAAAVRESGGYEPALRARGAEGCEDVLLQLRIARQSAVSVVPEYLVGYRRHPARMSGDFDKIVRSWRLVHEWVNAGRGPVGLRVQRWVDARCEFDIAEQRAVTGRYREALAAILKALLMDPVRSGLALLHRLGRTAVRGAGIARNVPPAPDFQAADPAARLACDPYEIAALKALALRLDAARLGDLADADR